MMNAHQARLLERTAKALAVTGGQTVADVLQAAREGRAQLWETDRLLVSTEILDYPRFRALRYVSIAGDLDTDDWTRLQARIDAWGRGEGCTKAETCGRHGWARVPQWTRGWRHLAGYWLKEIPDA